MSDINWMAFLTVFGAALFAAVFVVALYSLGIRFLATPPRPARRPDGTIEPVGPDRDDEDDDIDEEAGRPLWATIAANTCFGLSVVAVLVGIYLIVPALHG
ncbi:hypothetical protein ACIFOC_03042 [Leucobacter aridicollis]|uniref:Uncharacterized protein n=1 Tax=Leucobacter aridicollis TaxID=283878 RepID=A0A852QW68_9MICO|nr:hypothetical protein [Leucobacter aridicollis]MBL3683352.1 hypothetical protein [Leucobacter aridicollis]NYD25591.1 hypothetical protein [Leucobacter aridicollis]RKQ89688.1 hypothetical protein U746_0930 [Mycolicibacterium mucogenicum 261Sha1.1M5]